MKANVLTRLPPLPSYHAGILRPDRPSPYLLEFPHGIPRSHLALVPHTN
jgi:hypothetical protein